MAVCAHTAKLSKVRSTATAMSMYCDTERKLLYAQRSCQKYQYIMSTILYKYILLLYIPYLLAVRLRERYFNTVNKVMAHARLLYATKVKYIFKYSFFLFYSIAVGTEFVKSYNQRCGALTLKHACFNRPSCTPAMGRPLALTLRLTVIVHTTGSRRLT